MAFEDCRNREQKPFAPGGLVSFDLDVGSKILQSRIILSGSIVVTNATAGTAAIGDGICNLIKRIKFVANRAAGGIYPGGEIVDATPRSLLRYAMIQRQGKFMLDLGGENFALGADGTYTFYLSIPVYFADDTLNGNLSTCLNMDPVDGSGKRPIYTSVQCQISCASDLSGCFSGWSATSPVNFSGLTVQYEDDRLALTGDTVPLIQEEHYSLIAATQSRMRDEAMPADEGQFLAWLFLAEQASTTTQTLSQALLNKLTVYGGTVNYEEYSNDIQQRMLDSGFYDPSQSLTGQYFVDWTKGSLRNTNPSKGLLIQMDVNSVTGANEDQFRVYTRRQFPLAA